MLVHARLACRENYSVQSKLAVYLAAGKPIVATDFGDYRKLLGESGAGLLTAVEPAAVADGILRVLGDAALARRADELEQVARQQEAIQERLSFLLARLPPSPREDVMLAGEEDYDFSTEVRTALECILADWIGRLIRNLHGLARYGLEGAEIAEAAEARPAR